ncbi:hypothetical protein GEV33_010655 [Tenebrio molitor]|uniref:Uncharacterized protein n=1 Tax=Tenebrio molitor TaxID=7067 RepID=A0A8J6L8S0_TENMO|nr:hypothetical protein GEV33_010655 [Tenebrio molitor]
MGDACAGCEQAVIRDHREGELEAFVGLPESVGRARRGTLLVRLVEHDVDHNLKAHSSPTSSYKKIKSDGLGGDVNRHLRRRERRNRVSPNFYNPGRGDDLIDV